jgi:hypothetical protein
MFNAFDIETYVDKNNKLVPFCLCYIIDNEENFFYDENCLTNFIDMLMNKKDFCVIFAHNLLFDGSFLIKALSDKNIKFDALIIKRSIFSITFTNKFKYEIKFKCSYKFFPYSLSKANLLLSNCNEKSTFDHKLSNEISILTEKFKLETIKYCTNDVRIVISIMEEFNKGLIKLLPK